IHGVVSNDEIVTGYKVGRDQYVVIEPEEIDKLRTPNDDAIDVRELIRPDAIDCTYFTDKMYYLLPDDEAAARPYTVFRDAMHEQGRYGIAQVVLFRRERIVLVRPVDRLLAMTSLNYHGEFQGAAAFQAQVPRCAFLHGKRSWPVTCSRL